MANSTRHSERSEESLLPLSRLRLVSTLVFTIAAHAGIHLMADLDGIVAALFYRSTGFTRFEHVALTQGMDFIPCPQNGPRYWWKIRAVGRSDTKKSCAHRDLACEIQ